MVTPLCNPSGLQAVRVGVFPQERVSIALGDVAVGEVLLGMEIQGFRESADVFAGQDHHVPRSRHLPSRGQSVGIHEDAPIHSEFSRFLVHPFYEGLDVPADIFRDSHRGVIGRNHGHALDQVCQRDFASGLDEHP